MEAAAEHARSNELAAAMRARNPLEHWHVIGAPGEPAFGSGATADASDPPRFLKTPQNLVVLDGQVDNVLTGATMFVLPANYRPGVTDRFHTWGMSGIILVTSSGLVGFFAFTGYPFPGVGFSNVALSGISFTVGL